MPLHVDLEQALPYLSEIMNHNSIRFLIFKNQVTKLVRQSLSSKSKSETGLRDQPVCRQELAIIVEAYIDELTKHTNVDPQHREIIVRLCADCVELGISTVHRALPSEWNRASLQKNHIPTSRSENESGANTGGENAKHDVEAIAKDRQQTVRFTYSISPTSGLYGKSKDWYPGPGFQARTLSELKRELPEKADALRVFFSGPGFGTYRDIYTEDDFQMMSAIFDGHIRNCLMFCGHGCEVNFHTEIQLFDFAYKAPSHWAFG